MSSEIDYEEKIRLARIEKLTQEAELWDTSNIFELIVIIEDIYSAISRFSFCTDEIVEACNKRFRAIKSAKDYDGRAKATLKSLDNKHGEAYCICDKSGMCICSHVREDLDDIVGAGDPIVPLEINEIEVLCESILRSKIKLRILGLNDDY